MNANQLANYITEIGIDKTFWSGCSMCGSCAGKKIKCRHDNWELQLYFARGTFNLFKNGKGILGGKISEIDKIKDVTKDS